MAERVTSIPQKLPGQELEAAEVNQITIALDEVADEASTVSHVFSSEDFVIEGEEIIGGVPIPIIRINPDFRGGGGSVELTREAIIAALGSEPLPVSLLPDSILSPIQFETLSDGTIGIKVDWLNEVVEGSGVPLPVPPAPTNGVVDDDANTWTFTPAEGYVASQHETSKDGGGTWANNTSNIVSIGNVALASGMVITRVKYVAGVNASGAVLASTQPYTVTAGVITPGAPTNPIVNNTARTFTVTLPAYPAGLTFADLETTLDGELSWTTNTALAFPVGNDAKAIGMVKTRVKAATGRVAGPSVSNTVAFTALVSGGEQGTLITEFQYLDYGTHLNGTVTRKDDLDNSAAAPLFFINEDEIGFVSHKYVYPYTISGEGSTGSVTAGIGLDPHYGQSDALLYTLVQGTGQIVSKTAGQITQYSSQGLLQANGIMRMRFDATTGYIEYSNNAGATFTILSTTPRVPGVIRFKVGITGNQFKVSELRQYKTTI